ncbi:MAG: alpha-L-fucosidase, partial [Thermoguttaceae bacterium]|nr:alpha-L-fucosidase [Thermoguttaceae bacterium]
MEHVAVTNNPMSGEQSFPVETYSISNCYIIPQEAATQGALRLVADENASGVTTVSFSSNTAEDALQYQETKVYVGADGFSAYVQEKIDALTLELVAGETKTVTLPSEFGGEDIQYTVTKASGAQGYSIVSKNGNMLLSVPLRADGTFDEKEETILNEFGAWMKVNKESIIGTRPWKVFG